jgi:hypothetical protein
LVGFIHVGYKYHFLLTFGIIFRFPKTIPKDITIMGCNQKEKGRLKEQAQWHIKASNIVKFFGILQLIPLLDL